MKKLRVQPLTDIHLEFSEYNIKNTQKADVLILSGDIVVAEHLHDFPYDRFKEALFISQRQQYANRYRKFLKQCSKEYSHVIIICGNHEFYGGKWNSSIDDIKKECVVYKNIHFLECDFVKIKGVTFIGGTLWTNMNKLDPVTLNTVKTFMNDFSIIRNDAKNYRRLSPEDTVLRHEYTLQYFKDRIYNVRMNERDERVVIVSHHAPTFKSIHENYKADVVMNGAFASDLSEFILDNKEIVLWCHGHTHNYFDYMIGNTRVVCNPRGYHDFDQNENTEWNPELIIEV